MTQSQKLDYAMPRGGPEAQRLNYQHSIITSNVGFLLHPAVREKLTASSRIADVGCGTGIWLQELAKSEEPYSSIQYDGFDASDAQFPERSSVPSNIAFHTHNIKEPFPSEFKGQFDVVNLRWLFLGLQPEDYEPALRNLVELVKPGGAIQWLESDLCRVVDVVQSSPAARAAAYKAAMKDFVHRLGPRVQYSAANLERHFNEAGLVGVFDYISRSDHDVEHRVLWSKHCLESWYSTTQFLDANTGESHSKEAMDEQRREMLKDIESGAYISFNHHYVVGFKAE